MLKARQNMTNISANMHSKGMPLNIKLRAPKIELHFPNPFPIIIPEMAYNFFFNLGGEEYSHVLDFICEWRSLSVKL